MGVHQNRLKIQSQNFDERKMKRCFLEVCLVLPGALEDMDKDWFKTFVMGRNIHKVGRLHKCGFSVAGVTPK